MAGPSGSGGSGVPSGSGSGGSFTPTPHCITGIDVTYAEVTFPVGTTVGDPYCRFIPNDCCPGSGGESGRVDSGEVDLSSGDAGVTCGCIIGYWVEYRNVTIPSGGGMSAGNTCLPDCVPPNPFPSDCCPAGLEFPPAVCNVFTDLSPDGRYVDWVGTYLVPRGPYSFSAGYWSLFATGVGPPLLITATCLGPALPGNNWFISASVTWQLAPAVGPVVYYSTGDGQSTMSLPYCDPVHLEGFKSPTDPGGLLFNGVFVVTDGVGDFICDSQYPTADGGLLESHPDLIVFIPTGAVAGTYRVVFYGQTSLTTHMWQGNYGTVNISVRYDITFNGWSIAAQSGAFVNPPPPTSPLWTDQSFLQVIPDFYAHWDGNNSTQLGQCSLTVSP